MKKGFTIVELLMVVTIIAVLLGIVTTAAMRSIVQGGIDAYHRQNDKWPGAIETYAEKGEGHTLNATEYDDVMKELLKESTGAAGKNPVMDPTGLMVMRIGSPDNKTTGIDFRTAVTETKSLGVNQMTVVYPVSDTGRACRFTIKYNEKSDSVSVN